MEESYNSEPTCPFCGYKDHDWWEYGDKLYDGNVIKASCADCGKEYEIIVDIDVTFRQKN